MKDDLKAIYSGPLAQKARVVLRDGREFSVSGYVSSRSYDRDIDGRYRAKSQMLSFHCLLDDAQEFETGAMLFIEKIARKIVAITDPLDGTVILELSEQVVGRRDGNGSEGPDEDDDSSRFD